RAERAIHAAIDAPAQLASLDRLLATARLGALKRIAVPAHASVDRAWIAGGVVGAGRVRALAPNERFEEAVLADLAELQFRCSGALDAEFGLPRDAGTTQVATATLDCRGPRASVLALVYVHARSNFAALLHEGPPSRRDVVLDKQARLARALARVR
ncbi:MAG: hypothetical protein JWM77_2505, partial [Rhodospirillales bacterium]|nr:hypothetical protein [Rhodospirillales bacterium]